MHVTHRSQIAQQAIDYIGQLYGGKREVKHLDPDARRQLRQAQSKPLADATVPEDNGWFRYGQSAGLQIGALDCNDPVSGWWVIAD